MFLTVLKIVAAVVILTGLYFASLYFIKTYIPTGTAARDTFVAKLPTTLATAPAVQEVRINPSLTPTVASGPNPPNSMAPSVVSKIPEAVASDPYETAESEVPVGNTMRHPENSFGPGIVNSGNTISANAGIASKITQEGTTNFSPEFAQNGGQFMDGVFAHSVNSDDVYSDF
jgi:hypothetical protein